MKSPVILVRKEHLREYLCQFSSPTTAAAAPRKELRRLRRETASPSRPAIAAVRICALACDRRKGGEFRQLSLKYSWMVRMTQKKVFRAVPEGGYWKSRSLSSRRGEEHIFGHSDNPSKTCDRLKIHALPKLHTEIQNYVHTCSFVDI